MMKFEKRVRRDQSGSVGPLEFEFIRDDTKSVYVVAGRDEFDSNRHKRTPRIHQIQQRDAVMLTQDEATEAMTPRTNYSPALLYTKRTPFTIAGSSRAGGRAKTPASVYTDESRKTTMYDLMDETNRLLSLRESSTLSDFDVARYVRRGWFVDIVILSEFKLQEAMITDIEAVNIVTICGVGAMGTVFLGERKGRLMAIKRMLKSHYFVKKMTLQCFRERDALRRIQGLPGAVNYYGVHQDSRYLYIFMEYVVGGEFHKMLKRKGTLTSDECRFFVIQLIQFIGGLHNLDLVYRDCKPENTLLDVDGYLKMVDFGLARRFRSSADSKMRTVCGTPDYMAPEVYARSGYTEVADWWSLGCFLFEMTTGRPPFEGRHIMQIYANQAKDAWKKKIKWRLKSSRKQRDVCNVLLTTNCRQRALMLTDNPVDKLLGMDWFIEPDKEGRTIESINRREAPPVMVPKTPHTVTDGFKLPALLPQEKQPIPHRLSPAKDEVFNRWTHFTPDRFFDWERD